MTKQDRKSPVPDARPEGQRRGDEPVRPEDSITHERAHGESGQDPTQASRASGNPSHGGQGGGGEKTAPQSRAGETTAGGWGEGHEAPHQAASPKRCREIMTREPSYCVSEETAEHVAQLMKSEDVGAIPVVDDGEAMHLIGIVTDRDLALKIVAEGRSPGQVKVQDVMTGDPVVCHPEDDVQDALRSMSAHQVRRIPVVDDEGRLAGIIAQADIVTRIHSPEESASVIEHISQPAS